MTINGKLKRAIALGLGGLMVLLIVGISGHDSNAAIAPPATPPVTPLMAAPALSLSRHADGSEHHLSQQVSPMTSSITPQNTPQITPQQALEQLFTSSRLESNWFSTVFLSHISIVQLEGITNNLRQSLGAYQRVETDGDRYRLVFDGGIVITRIQLDAAGQITALLFESIQSNAVSLEQAIAQFQSSPGQASLLVMQGDTERAAVNADTPMAVGSTFKLAVLATLKQQITEGIHTWDEVVTLQPAWKSLPSGMLQTWPDGSRITLETLATLMISISDNTATDALIHILGREAIETLTPHSRPFLTTREAFALKNPENAAWLTRYRAGNEAERRSLLTELGDRPLPAEDLFAAGPVALDVEWLFSTRELCQLMQTVADLPLMGVNPGVAMPTAWSRIAYKGGSEPGVLNLTTQLTDANGTTYCVSATWNDPETELDEISLDTLYGGIIQGLSQP